MRDRAAIKAAGDHGRAHNLGRIGDIRLVGAPLSRLLERGANLAEHAADTRADRLDGDDDEHRNQARDQRIFDRRHAGFIADKVTGSKHGILLTLYGSLHSQAATVPSETFELGAGSRPQWQSRTRPLLTTGLDA
jgi:hypothetical protein